MEDFIRQEDLSLYRKVLSETTEDGQRESLIELIREEVAEKSSRSE